MNDNRRTFRGQGRAQDGNIPHSISRAVRAERAERRRSQNERERERRARRIRDVPPDEGGDTGRTISGEPDATAAAALPTVALRAGVSTPAEDVDLDLAIDRELRDEVAHIMKRIRNLEESIKLSSGIVNPVTWRQNVLNAVQNCVGEWRSIVAFHHLRCEVEDVNANDQREAEHTKGWEQNDKIRELGAETSLSMFGLLQHSLQCGPLAGGKPGYFKRCGGEVARAALAFLHADVFDGDLREVLLFSERQAGAVAEWVKRAERAAEKDDTPSKSMQKLQKGRSKKEKKKKKKAKGTKS